MTELKVMTKDNDEIKREACAKSSRYGGHDTFKVVEVEDTTVFNIDKETSKAK